MHAADVGAAADEDDDDEDDDDDAAAADDDDDDNDDDDDDDDTSFCMPISSLRPSITSDLCIFLLVSPCCNSTCNDNFVIVIMIT